MERSFLWSKKPAGEESRTADWREQIFDLHRTNGPIEKNLDEYFNKMPNHILIVDDAEEISALVAELLLGEGYEVSCASNGREALDLLRSGATLPDLILLDLMMPEMDGCAFRAEQEADSQLSSIPVLLMSAGGDLVSKARELGVRGYLDKPFKDVITILRLIGLSIGITPKRA